MADNAPGIDVSSYQSVLTRTDLDGLSFVFTKASDETATDPNFAANWAVLKSAGMHRGAYHELQGGSAGPQADHFLSVVKAAGLEAGDMLAVAASDYSGVTDAEVKAWCDQVQAAAHLSPVLVYSDLSIAATLTSCTKYDLWVAWPNPENRPATVGPRTPSCCYHHPCRSQVPPITHAPARPRRHSGLCHIHRPGVRWM